MFRNSKYWCLEVTTPLLNALHIWFEDDIFSRSPKKNSHAGFLGISLACVDIRPIKLTASVMPRLLLTSHYNPSLHVFKTYRLEFFEQISFRSKPFKKASRSNILHEVKPRRFKSIRFQVLPTYQNIFFSLPICVVCILKSSWLFDRTENLPCCILEREIDIGGGDQFTSWSLLY